MVFRDGGSENAHFCVRFRMGYELSSTSDFWPAYSKDIRLLYVC
jgi:hypothetical protein